MINKSKKLEFLDKLDNFIKILKEQVIKGEISQQKFLSILIEKLKAMQKIENINKIK
jgi:hypothetical protein